MALNDHLKPYRTALLEKYAGENGWDVNRQLEITLEFLDGALSNPYTMYANFETFLKSKTPTRRV